jgi:hypothetical protein
MNMRNNGGYGGGGYGGGGSGGGYGGGGGGSGGGYGGGSGGGGGGSGGSGGYGGGGSGGSGSNESYISYANLLKENFEGTSLDNLDSGNKNRESESKRVRIKNVDISKDNEEDEELVDLIKDNIINNEVIKKNKKGIKKIEKKAKSFLNINYKEFALLFFIYFLLSQEMIKDGFALYFTSLNPDNSGRIGVKGVIIYGLLLTTIFILLRNYLL